MKWEQKPTNDKCLFSLNKFPLGKNCQHFKKLSQNNVERYIEGSPSSNGILKMKRLLLHLQTQNRFFTKRRRESELRMFRTMVCLQCHIEYNTLFWIKIILSCFQKLFTVCGDPGPHTIVTTFLRSVWKE